MARLPGCVLHLLPMLLLLAGLPAAAQQMVSVAGNEVNMRSGPGKDHPVDWRLDRGYPLKVIATQGSWLKVVDFEDDEGWVHRPLTSSTPYHVVKAKTADMHSGPSAKSRVVSKLSYGTVLKTLKRSGDWVKLQRKSGVSGWVARRLLWGW